MKYRFLKLQNDDGEVIVRISANSSEQILQDLRTRTGKLFRVVFAAPLSPDLVEIFEQLGDSSTITLSASEFKRYTMRLLVEGANFHHQEQLQRN